MLFIGMARAAVAVVAVFFVHVLPIYFKRSRSDDVSVDIGGMLTAAVGKEAEILLAVSSSVIILLIKEN